MEYPSPIKRLGISNCRFRLLKERKFCIMEHIVRMETAAGI